MYMKYFARFYIFSKLVIQWNMLPQGFPSKSMVYDYFKLWKENPDPISQVDWIRI